MDQVTGAREHSSVGATGSMASSTHSKHYVAEPVSRDQLSRVVGLEHAAMEAVEWAPQQTTTTTTVTTTTAPAGQQPGEVIGGTGYMLQGVSSSTAQKAGESHEAAMGGRSEQVRKVSSTILESYAMETPPGDFERYVDEVVYEEVVTYKPVKETRVLNREVVVPKRQVKTVYKDVRPPPVIKKEIVMVYPEPEPEPEPEQVVVERPVYYDVEKKVYVDETVYVDEPEEQFVDEPVEVLEYDDEEVPVIISQTVRPVITESPNSFLDVNVVQYEPEVIPVDVHVAKPVPSSVQAGGVVSSRHRLVNISSPQYNTILRSLNTHLDETAQAQLPYTVENNVVKFVSEAENQFIIAPDGIEVEGYQLRKQPAAAYVHEEQVTALSSKISRSAAAATLDEGAVSRVTAQSVGMTAAGEAVFVGSRAPSAVADSNVFQERAAPKKRESPICCANAQYSDAGAAHLSEHASRTSSSSSSSSTSRNSSSQKPAATQRRDGGSSRQPRAKPQGPSYYTRSATTNNAQAVAGGARSTASSQRIETVHSYRSGMETAARRSHVCC